ncbi:MAG: response regulator [Spirochaetaceae bacterium]|nr:response regulator [Spirochaetaceae bacterium]
MSDKKIVLAVDDMPEVLSSINAILQEKYDVRLAVDANAATEALESVSVDLVLLDVEMPGMSGLQFIEKLQKDAKFKSIPVVFITANKENKTVQEALKKGAKGYIVKPFSPESLLESVEFFC